MMLDHTDLELELFQVLHDLFSTTEFVIQNQVSEQVTGHLVIAADFSEH